jgi:hypothetical protein
MLSLLRPRGNDSHHIPIRLRRRTRMPPSMRRQQIFQVLAVMAILMRSLPPLRNRHIHQTTSSHRPKHLSTHHNPTRRSKWHGNRHQPLPRLRCSVRSSKALDHHSRTAP